MKLSWLELRTCVSRRIIRSEDILGSMPIEQSCAIALFSSDCMAKGGSIPVFSCISQIKGIQYSNKKKKK
jgi:hypothetical protein